MSTELSRRCVSATWGFTMTDYEKAFRSALRAVDSITSPTPPIDPRRITELADRWYARRGWPARWSVSVAAALAVVAGVGVAAVALRPWEPRIAAAPAPTDAPSSPEASPSGKPAGCTIPDPQLVAYALEAVPPDAGGANPYAVGWLDAAMLNDVLAIQLPRFDGPEPSGSRVATVTVIDGGTGVEESFVPVTDKGAVEAAASCLQDPGDYVPERPAMSCAAADLATLQLRKGQVGPATAAYGSDIVDSAQVDAGGGYHVVAVRLAEATGPENTNSAAWVVNPEQRWLAPVSSAWLGGGAPEKRAVPWGPLARTAALDCVG